jgi:hypothetical protein
MAKQRNLVSLIIAVVVVAGLSQGYRPHLGTRLSALLDLALAIALFIGIRRVFARFESD